MLRNTINCFKICLLSGIISLSISCNHAAKTTEDEAEVKTPVTITSVSSKSVRLTVDLPAVSSFMNRSIVRATTTGVIEKVLINRGETANSGQLLFTIKTREAAAMSNQAGNDTSLSFKGVVNISSHNDGIISALSYRKGDFVQEGDELAVIAEQKSLVFLLEVPFELEKYISKNMQCMITLPDNSQISGKITGKLSDMDIQSQTVRYIIKPAESINVPENLIANVTLVKSENSKAQVISKEAVLGNETQTEFWVMKLLNDSIAIKVDIEKGYENNDEVEITKPLFLQTDRIILTGNYGLEDTAKIEIIRE